MLEIERRSKRVTRESEYYVPSEIGMKELIILVICFVLYVTAVEMWEDRMHDSRQGELVQQETSFTYVPPEPPLSDDGGSIMAE